MHLGLYSFGELTPDPATGHTISPGERMRDLVDEVVAAEAAGLDVFGLGEHHRVDYVVSAPAVVLAAAAARTSRIRLTSAVTVLSSDDPVRVWQQFATLDLLSEGRAEIMAGRGSFIESFPLFGYDLEDYDGLFEEKLDLLLALRAGNPVTWQGTRRAPLEAQAVYPVPQQSPLPLWVAVGGTPRSVARAGALGLPLAIAIIGGEPARFAPLAALYRETARRAGQDATKLAVGISLHGYVAATGARAREEFWPAYAVMMNRLGRERGWPPASRAQFDAATGPHGALLVGSPDEVAAKVAFIRDTFGADRLMMQMGVGTLPHARVLEAIALFGGEVAPRVRAPKVSAA